MEDKRNTKNQPFCWQEKKILRLLRSQYYGGKEHDKLRNLYLTLTEIYSDVNGQDIKYYTQTIARYSGLNKEWIPKGLKIFEKLKMVQLIEDRDKGKFKGKRLIFTPENIEEIKNLPNTEKINDDNTVSEFLEPSEDISYLEDNKRVKDINNTHTGEEEKANDNLKQENLSDAPVEIQDILKKYKELNLPEYNYRPDNHILLGVWRELGAVKLFEALTLMSKSEFVKNNMSINSIFKIENLKKALNGNFKDKRKMNRDRNDPKKIIKFRASKKIK
jgi:ssDNA-specific exonuclease RecJ